MAIPPITLRGDSWGFGGTCVRSGRRGLVLMVQQRGQSATTDNAEKWSTLKSIVMETENEHQKFLPRMHRRRHHVNVQKRTTRGSFENLLSQTIHI